MSANLSISSSCLSKILFNSLLAAILSAKVLVSSSLICLCVSASKSFFSIKPCIAASANFELFTAAVVAFASSMLAFILISVIPLTAIFPIAPISPIASPILFTISFPASIAASPTSSISFCVAPISTLNCAIFPSSPPPRKLSSQANIAPCIANLIA